MTKLQCLWGPSYDLISLNEKMYEKRSLCTDTVVLLLTCVCIRRCGHSHSSTTGGGESLSWKFSLWKMLPVPGWVGFSRLAFSLVCEVERSERMANYKQQEKGKGKLSQLCCVMMISHHTITLKKQHWVDTTDQLQNKTITKQDKTRQNKTSFPVKELKWLL